MRFFESTSLPELNDIDLLFVMGGPMSVNDEAVLLRLVQEKEFVRGAIRARKAVLGVCLGAQLIASARSRISESTQGDWLVSGAWRAVARQFAFPLPIFSRGLSLARRDLRSTLRSSSLGEMLWL